MKFFRILLHVFVFVFLTVLTQVGGLVYIVSLMISTRLKFRFRRLITFVVLYGLTTFLLVPKLAGVWGRESIKHHKNLKSANYFTVVLNRNYVTYSLNKVLTNIADDLAKSSTKIELKYLDACFPFGEGFPLLPHLSHNDGKKVDFSLIYEDVNGNIVNKSKSVSGYGVFEEPKEGEFNQNLACKKEGYWQYDFPKYLTLGKINDNLKFSVNGTRTVLKVFLNQSEVNKIFLEPHLTQRMQIFNSKLCFQGCRSVRHDDHIHLQIR